MTSDAHGRVHARRLDRPFCISCGDPWPCGVFRPPEEIPVVGLPSEADPDEPVVSTQTMRAEHRRWATRHELDEDKDFISRMAFFAGWRAHRRHVASLLEQEI